MQTGHIKLIKDKNGCLFALFYKNGTIFIKQYTGDFSSPQFVVSTNVLPDFSVFSNDSGIAVSVKKTNGDIFICKNTSDKWEEKLIFKASPTDNTKLYINVKNDRLNMIYNCKIQNIDTLNFINFSNRKWSKPYTFESLSPLPSSPYTIIKLSPVHIIIIFRNTENALTFKELYLDPFREGKALTIVPDKVSLADFSAIADEETLHMVYVAKGRFSNRLVYTNKESSSFTEGLVLWEDRRINNCLIYKTNNRIYVLTYIGTNIFAAFSDDNGKSFCPLYRHKAYVKPPVLKAEFISHLAAGCSEVFVSSLYPYEIVLADEFAEIANKKTETVYTNESKADTTYELNILKNKIELYEKQISEANKKIGELSLLLSKRNEELSLMNSKWLKRVENIRSSYEAPKYLPSVLVESPPHEEPSP